MKWDTRTNFCAAAGGSLRDGGEKLGGALLAVLFGSHGLTSCLHNTSTLGTHPSGRQKHAWHPPRNHGRSMAHGMTMSLVPVNQTDNRDLGEGVRGAAHRAQAVCVACGRRRRLQRRRSRLSEVTLIALYDVGIHVAILAHGALPALLAVADGHLSRLAAHGG